MSQIKWNENWSVGIRELDEQHQELVGLINALDTLHAKADREFLANVLTTLVEYTKRHFAEEEQMMIRMNYPQFEEHKLQHRHFTHKIEDFRAGFEAGRTELTDDILGFLKTWLATHILVHDKAYQTFRRVRSITA